MNEPASVWRKYRNDDAVEGVRSPLGASVERLGAAATDHTVESLAAGLRACRCCREAPLREPLPHEPRPIFQLSSRAQIVIASQAPGVRAHASGIPFDDASGRRLREWMGIGPDIFYDADRIAIVPMGFCFPGLDDAKGDRPPRPECRDLWHDAIFARLPAVALILTIGLHAMRYHMNRLNRWPRTAVGSRSMTDLVAQWRLVSAAGDQPRLIPLPHPSWRNSGWLNRNPWFAADVLPVLRAEVRRLTA